MKDNTRKTVLQKMKSAIENMLSLESNEIKLQDYNTKEGEVISVNDETKETETADGEYTLEDDSILVIADGKLSEVKPAEVKEEVQTAEETATEEVQSDVQAQLDALSARLDAVESALAKATEANAELSEINKELETKLSEIQSEPADKKVNLAANTEAIPLTLAQQRWANYTNNK